MLRRVADCGFERSWIVDESTSDKRGWVEHPVYVAGLSVAGTIAICIMVYKEVLLPAQMATSEFKIEELERQLRDVKLERLELARASEKANAELALEKDMLVKVKQDLASFKIGSLFFGGGVYPATFDGVKVGQLVEKVDKVFQGLPIEKDQDGFVTVKVDHPFFDSIVFYYRDELPHAIYQIMYSSSYDIGEKVGSEYLHVQLERNFGEPIKVAKDKYIWRVGGKFNIFKSSDRGFIISTGNNYPGGWDRALLRYMQSATVEEEMVK